MRLTKTVLLLAVAATAACEPETHSIVVFNRTSSIVSDIRLTIGNEGASLGDMSPNVQRGFIFDGELSKQILVEWEEPEKRQATIDTDYVPKHFDGAIILEIEKDGIVKKSLRHHDVDVPPESQGSELGAGRAGALAATGTHGDDASRSPTPCPRSLYTCT